MVSFETQSLYSFITPQLMISHIPFSEYIMQLHMHILLIIVWKHIPEELQGIFTLAKSKQKLYAE